MSEPTLAQRYQGLRDPGFLLYNAIYFYFATLFTYLRQLRSPFPLEKIRDEAFSAFWLFISGPSDPNVPLSGSAALVPGLANAASGTCLEVGPGSGAFMKYYARNDSITAIYGAEPCVGLHDQLSANARKEGLQSRYHIINAGAERAKLIPALATQGLLQDAVRRDGGVFDCIICIRVLCSVPQFSDTVEGLYDLLKPGGQLIVCEHVVNRWQSKGSVIARLVQLLYQFLGWTFFIGDCHLNRDIGKAITDVAKKDGGWRENGLDYHFEWTALPYVAGVLVKR